MFIDITSFFFNSSIEGATATSAWGTSIGQSKTKNCRIESDRSGVTDLLTGMIYKSKSDRENFDLSKGSQTREYLIYSIFEKIYINGLLVPNKSFIILLSRENTKSHFGRLNVSYPPYAKYTSGDIIVSNDETINEMRKLLGCGEAGCWFAYDISVQNQDELHFSCVVVNSEHPMVYKGTSTQRSSEWYSLIPQNESVKQKRQYALQDAHQIIFYGAPGTGKSNKIENCTNDYNRIRTTFHPDSDYSTFVGAYKPTMEGYDDKICTKGELINKLTELKNSGVPYPVHKFAAKYWRSLKNLSITDKKEILASCAMSDSYAVELDKGIAIGEEYLKKSKENRISYKYVPQSFLKAYVNAWNLIDKLDSSPYYLVIEEINRGNCAQIFGDLFQLLDRGDNGESKYAICPDDDIRRYLAEQFNNATNIPIAIKSGNEMRLPSNLYIWATMNTSDQSLFPIDSAFKRRWDWEYIPIEKGDKDFVIEIGNKKYDWWNFISIINGKIDEITGSEDKKLGYWFAKPAGNTTTISCDQFVSKVLFYLWNDIYKDYTDDNRSIFRITDSSNISKKVAFTEFFGTEREIKLHAFMRSNGITEILSEAEITETTI